MREKHESGVHHTTGQSRDFEADSGAAFARRYWYKENSAGKGTPTQDISRRQEKNRSGTAGTLGEDQGSEEIEADTSIRAAFNIHYCRPALETGVDLLLPGLNRRLDSGLLRGECVGQVEFSFHDPIRIVFLDGELCRELAFS
jgi:hypothetical protein